MCMALFFIGLILFALAKNMNTIIIGWLLQGFVGGGIEILAEVIVADMTRHSVQEREKYLGLMAIPVAIDTYEALYWCTIRYLW